MNAKPCIAIVDDDPSIRRAMKRLVRSRGMDAEVYSSGEEFLQRMDGVPSLYPDCIILDVQMPGLSGLEVQRRLRSATCGLPPVIFITGNDNGVLCQRALAGGAAACLVKPFGDDVFSRTLDAALTQHE